MNIQEHKHIGKSYSGHVNPNNQRLIISYYQGLIASKEILEFIIRQDDENIIKGVEELLQLAGHKEGCYLDDELFLRFLDSAIVNRDKTKLDIIRNFLNENPGFTSIIKTFAINAGLHLNLPNQEFKKINIEFIEE